ncbi:3-oxoacyl-ACP synthase [Hufsiella ginkgonis]|uniref:3-oxoacyl-ACP synthase n=1 Tax=Hufsiella ginkgonis TaxID=2695274 RepID=A0A7K1XZZ5_9SPHI|nr:3-oxoacyl-ACP synthase [Hufsiella ginkgonis]MXV16595.1 3-oxoacyl-ACP synthase [Hufsiella ginkgonis]
MTIKEQLYQYCLEYTEVRIAEAKRAIAEVQEASRSETKSSAGDKYETGRAMIQQEIDRNQAQLYEAGKLKAVLDQLSSTGQTNVVHAGSLVITDRGNFYIAISAGKTVIDGQDYYTISLASPLGAKLAGLVIGKQALLNGKCFRVKEVL